MRQLVPAAEQLSPTLIAFSNLAPEAKGFFEGLPPVIDRAPTGFPALRKLFRDDFPPLLRAVDPFLRNLNPLLTGLDLYKHEVTAFFGNIAATFSGVTDRRTSSNGRTAPLPAHDGPDQPRNARDLRQPPRRPTATAPTARPAGPRICLPACPASIRASAARGLRSRSTRTRPTKRPSRNGPTGLVPAQWRRIPPGETLESINKKEAEYFFNRLKQYAFAEQESTASVPAPGCAQQSSLKSIYGTGESTLYQHTFEQGN